MTSIPSPRRCSSTWVRNSSICSGVKSSTGTASSRSSEVTKPRSRPRAVIDSLASSNPRSRVTSVTTRLPATGSGLAEVYEPGTSLPTRVKPARVRVRGGDADRRRSRSVAGTASSYRASVTGLSFCSCCRSAVLLRLSANSCNRAHTSSAYALDASPSSGSSAIAESAFASFSSCERPTNAPRSPPVFRSRANRSRFLTVWKWSGSRRVESAANVSASRARSRSISRSTRSCADARFTIASGACVGRPCIRLSSIISTGSIGELARFASSVVASLRYPALRRPSTIVRPASNARTLPSLEVRSNRETVRRSMYSTSGTALAASSRSASPPWSRTKSAGSKPSGRIRTTGWREYASRNWNARSAARAPASSESNASTIRWANRDASRKCPSPSAVPHVATAVSIPACANAMTSVYPSTTWISPVRATAPFARCRLYSTSPFR